MPIKSDYGSKCINVFGSSKDAQNVLEKLHTCVKEGRLVALPTADYVEDTRPSGFSNDQLNGLKTYPTSDSNQDYISMTDEQRNAILIQNLNSAQNSINVMEDNARDDYCRILVAGGTGSGKSTFINGLSRRKILPSEGSSLTSKSVEILDARDIGGKEEVHLCRKGMNYDYKNASTFARDNIRNLYNIMQNWDSKWYSTMYNAIKVYVNHQHAHTDFLGNIEYKVHMIESVDDSIDNDKIHSLLKKQEIDVVIFIIDARYGLTETSRNMMKNYCKESGLIFVVITHLDCVCLCRGVCRRSCEEICKQEIMNAIEEISPKTFESANELIHFVNPTLVPLQNNNSDYATRQMPLEWTHMETCLYTFIHNQFYFHKQSLIEDYLKKLMHDVILFAQLNEATILSKIEEKKQNILQLEANIGQLEDGHTKAYIEAKNKISKTISDICDYILETMNDLKENPEKFVSKEMISRIDPKNVEVDLRRLLQERWKEIENEINHKVNEYIQNCANDINQLVEGLPEDSTHRDFTVIKSILQDAVHDVSDTKASKKSLKSIVQEIVQQVLSGSRGDSVQTWTNIMYQTFIEINQNFEKDPRLTMSYDERQENGQETPFDGGITNITIALGPGEIKLPIEVISAARMIMDTVLTTIWSVSVDKIYEEAKRTVKETLSNENFEDHATHAAKMAETRLIPLLDSKINNCYAAAIAEQTKQFLECCEEIEHLDNDRAFFQQLNEEATQIYAA